MGISMSITDSSNDNAGPGDERVKTKASRSMTSLKRASSGGNMPKAPTISRPKSCPQMKPYDDCREFGNFAGQWLDSKGQLVVISPWGVVRYPSNPKLRFEAFFMGPNHLSVMFDKDPKRRRFVGRLNHSCNLLIWSNDTKWVRKGAKIDPKLLAPKKKEGEKKKRNSHSPSNNSCLVM